MDIPIIWALIILFATVMYTIFDGFDLGVGILLALIKDDTERDIMVNTITPIWDGNESWIVLAGVGLFGGFPAAYSILLPALYLPVVIMVVSLALRGIAMEFRFLSIRNKLFWDAAFGGGSIMAAFCQGLILANLVEGIQPRLSGIKDVDPFYFLTPFTVCTGLLVVLLYALIGASWLNLKTEKPLQVKFKKMAKGVLMMATLWSVLLCWSRFALQSFTPRFTYHSSHRLFDLPPALWAIGAMILVCILFWALSSNRDALPFTINIVLMIYLAVLVTSHLWPFVVPPYVNLYHSGSPLYGNTILLISALIVIPVILSYLTYSYHVFKGKTISENNYEPVWVDDQTDLQQHGIKPQVKVQSPIHLSWTVRLLLVIFWFILFFIVLGFLGDHAAILTIALLIIVFLVCWYRSARKEDLSDE